MRRGIAVIVATVGILGASCVGDPAPTSSDDPGPPRCGTVPGRALEGFALVDTVDVPASDHVGVRMTLRDREGAEITYLLGIEGEVGEGLPLVDQPSLADGTRARLLGEARTWALAWEGNGPCGATAVIGSKIEKGRFLDLLRSSGLLAAA